MKTKCMGELKLSELYFALYTLYLESGKVFDAEMT